MPTTTLKVHPYPGSELTCERCKIEQTIPTDIKHFELVLSAVSVDEGKLEKLKSMLNAALSNFLTDTGESWTWNENR